MSCARDLKKPVPNKKQIAPGRLSSPIGNEDGIIARRNGLIAQLRGHVEKLSLQIGERNPGHYQNLQQAALYIQERFSGSRYELHLQNYQVRSKSVSNILLEKKGNSKLPLLIVGAHYDSAPGTPGADDNASAVAVLIESALALEKTEFRHPIQFVFFTLEEPPFFTTDDMGSVRFAKKLQREKQKVRLMISLEMLGYFSDEKIQSYPLPLMKLKYPRQGNFVAIVGTGDYQAVTREFFRIFREEDGVSAELLIAPRFLPGIDFSDHLAFWNAGYPALMLTDTAFYRNPNYHTAADLPATLDYEKMARLTEALNLTLKKFDEIR